MKAKIERRTDETSVKIGINLKGKGKCNINSGIPFFDHMLKLFAYHAGFDLKVAASGDTEVDDHHLVEDIGIALGQAFKKALGPKKGIKRYGNFLMPMDEALSYVAIDLSSRPYLSFESKFRHVSSEKFDYFLLEDFFRAFTSNSGSTMHVRMLRGRNNHHMAESIFKGFGKALAEAVSRGRLKGVPSTKGKL